MPTFSELKHQLKPEASILEGWGFATPRFWAGGSWGGRRLGRELSYYVQEVCSKSGDF